MGKKKPLTLLPKPGELYLRSVVLSNRTASGLWIPDVPRTEKQIEWVVKWSGYGCRAAPGDRVLTEKKPGEVVVIEDVVYRKVIEHDDVVAILRLS